MHSHDHRHADPFGHEHAAQYDASAASGLAGYHAMLDVMAAAMSTALKGKEAASVLCVGVGTGQELLPYARFGAPAWRFTGVDPSPHMLAIAQERVASARLQSRVRLEAGMLQDLPAGPRFDGAQMLGVLHHVKGEAEQRALLREVARRLEPGAPFILGGHVGTDPVLVAVEEELRRVGGATEEQLARRRDLHAHLDVPASEEALFALLRDAGLTQPRQLFASLRFRIFLARAAT